MVSWMQKSQILMSILNDICSFSFIFLNNGHNLYGFVWTWLNYLIFLNINFPFKTQKLPMNVEQLGSRCRMHPGLQPFKWMAANQENWMKLSRQKHQFDRVHMIYRPSDSERILLTCVSAVTKQKAMCLPPMRFLKLSCHPLVTFNSWLQRKLN